MAVTRADLIAARFGAKVTHYQDRETATLDTTVRTVLRQDPNRLAATIVNLSPGSVYLKPRNDVSAASAVRLAANGGVLGLNWQDDLDLVGQEWFGTADAAGASILSIEIATR